MSYIDCQEAMHRLSDYLNRELNESNIKEIHKHLDLCSHCAERYHFEETLLSLIRQKAREDIVPPGLRERLYALLHSE